MFQCINNFLPSIESFFVILGVIFIAIQIRQQTKISRADHDRQKKQSTIEFYNLISTESQTLLDAIVGKKLNLDAVNSNKMLRKSVVRYLSRLERLAIGIATDVYDFDVLNLMSGRYLCKKHEQFREYIEESRVKKGAPMLFKEFELLVLRIEEYRKINPCQTADETVRIKKL